jgi:hypothetical protein
MRVSISVLDRMISDDRHSRARRIIRRALKKSPDDHRLLTALARSYSDTSWGGDRECRVAMAWHRRALAVAPECPIVLWDYAETAGGKESIATLRRLIARGPHSLICDGCIRSQSRARKFITRAYWLLSLWHMKYSQWQEAIRAARLCVRRAAGSQDLSFTASFARTVIRWCREEMVKATTASKTMSRPAAKRQQGTFKRSRGTLRKSRPRPTRPRPWA